MQGEAAEANLALAGLAGTDDAVAIVGEAHGVGRQGDGQVAAAGQERKFDAHHGQSAGLDHPVAVDEYGRDAAAERQSQERGELAHALTNFGLVFP